MRYCNNGGCMGAQPGYAPAGMNRTRRIIDSEYPIAMAYVPWQRWGETYDAEKALCRGTLFPALDLPFTGCDCERGLTVAENNLCQLTREVQRQTFTALECRLYLNTHPDCQEAAAAFAKACEKLDAARTAYNEAAPLTPCAAAGSRN